MKVVTGMAGAAIEGVSVAVAFADGNADETLAGNIP